jgi:hypothetical protein
MLIIIYMSKVKIRSFIAEWKILVKPVLTYFVIITSFK